MTPSGMRGFKNKIIKSLPSLLVPDPIPERLRVRPVDMWGGDGHKGQDLCKGIFTLDGEKRELYGECWEPIGASDRWLNYLHGFRWLRDLRSVGTAAARQQAQALIESWADQYVKPVDFPWRADLVGERISLWVSHYDFIGAEQAHDFDDVFFASLYKQAKYLARILPRADLSDIATLRAVKGLLYAGVALDCADAAEWRVLALALLERVLKTQIHPDGGHVSRSAFILVQALKLLLEMRAALQAAGQTTPEFIHDAASRMVPAVRFLRYGDRHFGLFQGAMRGDVGMVDSILAQAGVRGRKVTDLPDSGYHKAVLGRSLLFFDVGAAAQHTAPLAFEMAYGKDRIFVNCGSHGTDAEWEAVLAGAAAHCTVSIAGPALSQYAVRDIKTQHDKDFVYMQASHDGFVRTHGVKHKRSLYLTADGHDLRGEDLFTAMSKDGGPVQPQMMSARFHLHPRVMVSLTADGQAALLRLPNGVGWRFQQVGGFRLKLEDSIYCADAGDPPRKTQQLVIESAIGRDQQELSIKWALRREGL